VVGQKTLRRAQTSTLARSLKDRSRGIRGDHPKREWLDRVWKEYNRDQLQWLLGRIDALIFQWEARRRGLFDRLIALGDYAETME
jgi:hypothetical protein